MKTILSVVWNSRGQTKITLIETHQSIISNCSSEAMNGLDRNKCYGYTVTARFFVQREHPKNTRPRCIEPRDTPNCLFQAFYSQCSDERIKQLLNPVVIQSFCDFGISQTE